MNPPGLPPALQLLTKLMACSNALSLRLAYPSPSPLPGQSLQGVLF